MRFILLVLAALWFLPGVALAGCYDLPQTKALRSYAAPAAARQVTVMIDQTTYFPETVRQHVLAQISRLATAGTEIGLGSFSSYSGTRFPRIETSVQFESGLPPSAERSVSRRARDMLKACIVIRQRQGVAQLQNTLRSLFQAARPLIGQSDIMSAIQQFGTHVRASRARDKILVIVSDSLENSSSTSFYRARKPRSIDPGAELRIAASHGLVADLGRARVYMIGTALVPGNEEQTMPSELVRRLELFWDGYLRRSNASAVRIGKPMLLEDIG